MAGTTTHVASFRTTVADLVDSTIGASGKLVFHTSAMATADTGVTGVVATLPFSATAFGAASGPTITANAITSDTNAAGGTIAFATFQTSGSAVVVHTTVSTTGDAINVTSGGLTVTAGDTVSCSALTYTAMA